MKSFLRIIPSFLLLAESFCFLSCKAVDVKLQQQYGADSDYYIGLQNLTEGNQEKAVSLFRNCRKNGSKYAARRSAEALTHLGNVQQRTTACNELVQAYNDDDSLLYLCNELTKDEEFAQLIQKTDSLDITKCNNKLVILRLNAMLKKADSRLSDTIYQWYTAKPISRDHYQFYLSMLASSHNLCDMNKQIIITFRVETYRKSYINAYKQLASVISVIESNTDLSYTTQIISDMGKVCLYGSNLWHKNAQFFNTLAKQSEEIGNRQNAFYAWFYAARLYETGRSYQLASNRYVKAMTAATEPENSDNSLWYLLNMNLSISTENAIDALQTYCSKWHNPQYFSDFFNSLSVLLLSQRKWNDFYKVYTIIRGYADDGTSAKYAYLSGRLIETKLAHPDKNTDEEPRKNFQQALNSGEDPYYKLLAADRLGLSGDNLEKILSNTRIDTKFIIDRDAEKLLSGYAAFGFPQYVYPEWQRFSADNCTIGLDCAVTLADFLRNCNTETNEYYVQSLRIIARTAGYSDKPLSDEALKLLYPQNFHSIVQKVCAENDLSEYLLYALIRSESFFDPDIESHAGAVGLTQLMRTTAADIAKKKKLQDYDLNNPETNIEFGASYLKSLSRRLGNSDILALFAYNSGISRVRSWLSYSHMELGSGGKLPKDLFLETIPFAETRNYGRKVLSAAIMYGTLYYNKTPGDIITEILK